MSELEEKLNSILSSPKDMERILGLAKELSGSVGNQAPQSHETPKAATPSPLDFASIGDIDPSIFKIVSRLLGEYNSTKNDKSALIASLKPYIRKEHQQELDRALKIAKIAHIAKIAFSEFSGGDFHL